MPKLSSMKTCATNEWKYILKKTCMQNRHLQIIHDEDFYVPAQYHSDANKQSLAAGHAKQTIRRSLRRRGCIEWTWQRRGYMLRDENTRLSDEELAFTGREGAWPTDKMDERPWVHSKEVKKLESWINSSPRRRARKQGEGNWRINIMMKRKRDII